MPNAMPMALAGLKNYWLLLLLLFFPILFFHFFPCNVDAYDADFPSANLSTSWRNNPSNEKGSVKFIDGCTLRPILLVYNKSFPPFGLGFFTNTTSSVSNANSFYLVVFMLTSLNPDIKSEDKFLINEYYPPQVLWSANRDKPVGENATLDFTAQGELVLNDADGSLVWSTIDTSAHSVARRMKITVGGNLVLLNGSNGVVWQSYDHPTDTWLPNQVIYADQRLIARSSNSNLSTGIYYLSVTKDEAMGAFIDSNPPKQYALLLDKDLVRDNVDKNNIFFRFKANIQFISKFTTSDFWYIVLEPNGHLILYEVEIYDQFNFIVKSYLDILSKFNLGGDCIYPTVCGRYGVCLGGGQCECPREYNGNTNYFRPFERGVECAEITPLSFEDGFESHTFVNLPNVTYFDFVPMLFNTSVEKCKETCLSNHSCKVALFRYGEDISSGNCSLKSEELYSFRASKKKDTGFNSYAFIKVQKVPEEKDPASLVPILAPSLLGGGLVFVTFVGGTCYRYRMLKNTDDVEEEDDDDDQVIEALKKFSLEELRSSTHNFQIKLGQGGFGSVFEGVLCDGTKVAVKCLESMGQGKKEFLAEVNTIGKVDHFNLVRLIGYCVEKSNRLLVYEHMSNGSLDRWIFNPDKTKTLNWKVRQKIIFGVAKGLEYLHEECRRNIIHFDIKPQNILLDGDFNAKISDFGLAKLIDKDQSLVLTALKGTLGYLAPELFEGSVISVKVDVYSLGIVILETVCGRKNLDSSQSRPLINIVKMKAEENRLYDLIDERIEDIRRHKEEAIKMIKIGIWCLQTHDRRPGISMVVKALEGSIDMDLLITDHYFLTMSHMDTTIQVNPNISFPEEASILSGPR